MDVGRGCMPQNRSMPSGRSEFLSKARIIDVMDGEAV